MKRIQAKRTGWLIGWKAIADYLGYHWQTVRYWHHTRLKLPFVRTHPSEQGRVAAPTKIVDVWFKEIGGFKMDPKTEGKVKS